MTSSRQRLRRLLLPTWPPQDIAEGLLLIGAVAAAALLLELWFLPGGELAAVISARGAGLAVAGALLRAMALGLLFAVAARLAFGVACRRALGLGAVVLASLWSVPLLAGPVPALSPMLPWAVAIAATLLALLAGAAGRRGPGATLGFALAAGVLGGLYPHYGAAHAWLLDALGLSVRGALVGGFDGAHRRALDGVPLAVLALLAWLLPRSPSLRDATRLLLRTWGVGPLLLGAIALAWGFVDAGRRLGMLEGLLHPPALYAPVAQAVAVLLLAVVAAALRDRRRRRAEPLAASAVVVPLAGALLFGLIAGPQALPALAVAGLVLLVLAVPPGPPRPVLLVQILMGGLLALALWAAGAATVPGMAPERMAGSALALAGVAGAGASIAGLCRLVDEASGHRAGRPPWPRAMAALWLADFAVALCAVAFAAGRLDLAILGALAAGALVPAAPLLGGRGLVRARLLPVAAALPAAALLAMAVVLR